MEAAIRSKPDLDTAVKDATLKVRIDLREGRSGERRKHDLALAALSYVGDVLGVDEEAKVLENLFAEYSDNGVGAG